MAEHRITEYVELDGESEWRYLRRYWDAASRFFAGDGAADPSGAADFPQQVVSEDEIQRCIRSFKRRPSPKARREVKLEDWRFAPDDGDEGVRRGWFGFGCDDAAWEAVRVPHSVNRVPENPVRYGSTPYRILVPDAGQRWDIWTGEYGLWYRARVGGALRKDQVASLQFDSVNLVADVWLNEMPVMMGHVGLFPFAAGVTDEMGWGDGGDALVAVRVKGCATNTPYLFANGLQVAYGRRPYLKDAVPDTDWRDESWSGIAGDVTLRITSTVHIESVFLSTVEASAASAVMSCRLELRNQSWDRFRGTVRVSVAPWLPDEGPEAASARASVDVLPMNEVRAELSFRIRNPELWGPDHPSLYLAHVTLVDASGKDIDDIYEVFGVRTFRMVGGAFLLNGKRFVPRGTHDLASYAGDSLVCPSDRSIVRDILLHKKMGATCSRWPSDIRMHYPRIAEYADQLGFLISWTGYFEMWTVHPQMELHARRDVPAMVRSLRNRPSVVVWEMGDEPLLGLHGYRRLRWYQLVRDLVAAEDGTRPIIPAGWWSNELLDLIERRKKNGIPAGEARRQALAEYPVFGLENSPWDIHYCPYLPPAPQPVRVMIDRVREDFNGERATIFTEFGIDGMPRPENVSSYYGGFTWSAPAIMPIARERKDRCYYGRSLGPGDWRESQAAQAVLLSSIIGQLREHPEAFAGYYFPTLVDAWNFFWGAVDAGFNAKLAWHAVRTCYATTYVSGLHGSAAHERGEAMEITAGSFADAVRGATLAVAVKDEADRVVLQREFAGVSVPGEAGMKPVARLDLGSLDPGLYSIEYRLRAKDGGRLADRIELFYLREGGQGRS